MVAVGDPIGTGLVASLARPGGNVTGLTSLAPDLEGKRLELIREIVPKSPARGVLEPRQRLPVVIEKQVQAAAERSDSRSCRSRCEVPRSSTGVCRDRAERRGSDAGAGRSRVPAQS